MSRRLALLLPASALALGALASPAAAKSNYMNTWQALYPGSSSGDNVINGTGTSCQLCHRDKSGGAAWNPYGWEIREGFLGGMSLSDAILAAEPLDSDQDPTGAANLAEIDADSQPGWTDGDNNTIHFSDGSTSSNQPPPNGILGTLDPGLGTSYCGPAELNSSGFPGVIAAEGSPLVADNDVTLNATQLPSSQFGYFLNSMTQGFVQNPGGSQGNLCLGGGIGRYSKQIGNTGTLGELSLVLDLTQTPTPSGPVAIQPGETWNFTCWFRDKNPNQTSNFTDGVSITFQ